MRITLLSASAGATPYQFAPSYLINETLVIDAGSIGFATIERQKAVRSVVLSHAHMDHIASLPLFLDNVYQQGPQSPTVYASQSALDALHAHFFNDVIWPDVVRLSKEESPFARFVALENAQPIAIEGVTVTPVALDHVVPTFGFLVDDGTSAVAIVSDTAPTTAIWEHVRANPRMKTVFLESAFPNNMRWLAEKAKHLTPNQFREECQKAGPDVPLIAIHIKPAFYNVVEQELRDLNIKSLVISEPNMTCVV